jgi:methylase of polypeptide subunit release factors
LTTLRIVTRKLMIKYSRERYGNIKVLSTPHLEGGGRDFGQALVRFVEERIGPVESMLEWCSGPGFIGFAALGGNVCQKLGLADINEEAILVCRKTVRENQLSEKVRLFTSDCFDSIPPEEHWDVVVGNPPHRGGRYLEPRLGPALLYIDEDWKAHRRFYRQVPAYLNPGGSVALIESRGWSKPDVFKQMASENGLEWLGDFPVDDNFYITWARSA